MQAQQKFLKVSQPLTGQGQDVTSQGTEKPSMSQTDVTRDGQPHVSQRQGPPPQDTLEWEMCENPSNYESPEDGQNPTYNLWQLGDLRLLIRCKYHGTYKPFKSKKAYFVNLQPKLEYQPQYGVEQVTYSETARE